MISIRSNLRYTLTKSSINIVDNINLSSRKLSCCPCLVIAIQSSNPTISGVLTSSLPCSMDMEISAGNITGGRGSPPPHPQSSPTARLMLPSVTANGSDIVNNLNKISRDHPLEDRGVDLSFDVKKETEIKTENCDIIKSEFKLSEHCEASMLHSPGED